MTSRANPADIAGLRQIVAGEGPLAEAANL